MQFEDDDIGGREVGASVRFNIIGNPVIGASMQGYARVLLGNLKMQMGFHARTLGTNNQRVEGPVYTGSFYDLLANGVITGLDTNLIGFLREQSARREIPAAILAKLINVEITSIVDISTTSIKGQDGMADNDSIDIQVQSHANVDLSGIPDVVGFSIHFKDTNPWNANGWYWVAEPYGAINAPCLLTGLYRNPNLSVSMNSRETMMAIQWYSPNNTQYLSVAPWLSADPIAGDFSHFVNISNWIWSFDPAPALYHHSHYLTTSASGKMYLIDKGHFNHIKADKNFTYKKGYVGKAACHLYKDIEETPQFYSEFLKNEFYLNAGEYIPTLTGNILKVPHAKTFEKGWYGIGMMADVQGGNSGPVMGGCTFVYHMSDGTDRRCDFDVDLWCGNYSLSGSDHSPLLMPGTHWIMFNPRAGIANLYQGDNTQNPFYDPVTNVPTYAQAFTTALVKPGTPELKAIKSFYALAQ